MDNYKIISIITPSFNHAEYIEETIDSVLSQEGTFLLDYIVMDGGSADNTVDILKHYEKRITSGLVSAEYKGLKFYKSLDGDPLNNCKGVSFRWFSEKDKGQADAINKGFRLAEGDILAFLNSDDTYYPGTIQKVVSFNWRGADFIYGQGMWVSKEGKELLLYPTFKPNKYNFVYQCTLCQPAVFMKRETFEKLGEFSYDYHVVFDFEYWMRAVFSSMKFKYVDSLLATSRFYVENKTMAEKDTQINEVPLLKKMYYSKPFNFYGRLMVKRAKKKVHKPTVERVNKLHDLIKSDIRYVFK